MSTLPTDSAWKIYGKFHPYFGVTGDNQHLTENLNEQSLQMFFESGQSHVKEMFSIIHEKIDKEFKPHNILDFGCGPGRFVIPLSNYCKEVVGMDISNKMLQEALSNCEKFHVNNARFVLSDDSLSKISDQKFDLVNSFIVLQHLNIKRGERLIRLLCEAINNNGIGILHVTYYDNYPKRKYVNYFRFRLPIVYQLMQFVKSIILKKKFRNLPLMQMNNYNLNRIFSILQKNGVNEIFSSFTDHYNYWGITIFFKKKDCFHN